ncbi:MAG TPA: hypothetical protein GXZ47_02875 [Treponema sp.]|nr:hypothetical protein [Treponema sp.]
MQKKICITLLFILLLTNFAIGETQQYTYGNYQFTYADESLDILEIGKSFMALRTIFYELCGFDPDPNAHLANVRILADQAAFDEYLSTRIGGTRNQFVFLKYSKPELSELVLYPAYNGNGYTAFAGPSLNRQLFLQYIYSYVLEPPVWLRDGLQAWMENYSLDGYTVIKKDYPPWLETAKRYALETEKKCSVIDIISAETGSFEASRIYPLSWALVAFFLQTERYEYQRFMHEIFVILENSEDGYNKRSQKENTQAIAQRFIRNPQFYTADEDLLAWLSNQKTFPELVQNGVNAYNNGQFEFARVPLLKAVELQPIDPLPSYYLGLSFYADGSYEEAEKWYQQSLANGADGATVHWALALNSYAQKRFDRARYFVNEAQNLSPERYKDKAQKLLNSMMK